MEDKTFTVSHAHARAPLVIRGKTLEAALAKERLDPAVWVEVTPGPEPEPETSGKTSEAPE